MRRPARLAAAAFAATVVTGTIRDSARVTAPRASDDVLVADLHVHPWPGDGTLPVWELQREAARRGLDVLAVAGHNNRAGVNLGNLVGVDPSGPIIIPGQEITTPTFHLIAVGTERLIDWHLTAAEAIDAIHAQGGVAIAAHPALRSWRVEDETALRKLDGAEVAHPSDAEVSRSRLEFAAFFERARSVNGDLAPIGSSDFHTVAPLGRCRTYLLAGERTAAAALDAVRQGRTVAADPEGKLFGRPEDVARVQEFLARTPKRSAGTAVDRIVAVIALLALAILASPDRVELFRGRTSQTGQQTRGFRG